MTTCEIKPCPCGKTPTDLVIEPGATCKYAWVSGNCCTEWSVEFHTGYYPFNTIECKEKARQAWNQAGRTKD